MNHLWQPFSLTNISCSHCISWTLSGVEELVCSHTHHFNKQYWKCLSTSAWRNSSTIKQSSKFQRNLHHDNSLTHHYHNIWNKPTPSSFKSTVSMHLSHHTAIDDNTSPNDTLPRSPRFYLFAIDSKPKVANHRLPYSNEITHLTHTLLTLSHHPTMSYQ